MYYLLQQNINFLIQKLEKALKVEIRKILKILNPYFSSDCIY